MKNREKQIRFSIIDNSTGKYPDLYNIALKEDWAKGLMYCDMEGFAINEDGQLILFDECGNFVYCPYGRFTIVFEDSVVTTPTTPYETCSQNDMIVISREEYNALLLEQKRLKEIVDRIPCGYELKEITRKEMAEKFITWLKENILSWGVCGDGKAKGNTSILSELEEFSKQFGDFSHLFTTVVQK